MHSHSWKLVDYIEASEALGALKIAGDSRCRRKRPPRDATSTVPPFSFRFSRGIPGGRGVEVSTLRNANRDSHVACSFFVSRLEYLPCPLPTDELLSLKEASTLGLVCDLSNVSQAPFLSHLVQKSRASISRGIREGCIFHVAAVYYSSWVFLRYTLRPLSRRRRHLLSSLY